MRRRGIWRQIKIIAVGEERPVAIVEREGVRRVTHRLFPNISGEAPAYCETSNGTAGGRNLTQHDRAGFWARSGDNTGKVNIHLVKPYLWRTQAEGRFT